MIFKKPLAKFLNTFTDKPISDKMLTIIDIVITLIGTIATIVGIAVAFQFGLLSSIFIALIILAIIPVTIIFFILFNKYVRKKNFSYTPHNPVTPPLFVGRERLFTQLANALERKESISLVGDRRIGKTSVLITWQQQVQAQNRLVIYVSGENAEAKDLSQFIKKITKQRASDDPEDAANVLSEWAEEQTKATGYPPLILVDEAERFIAKFPPRFFERLRGMLERVVWIFASRSYIDEVYKKFHHETSPFENRLALHQLGLLEQNAADQLIKLGRLTPEETELMHTWAGRHPFFLQLLGKSLLAGRGESAQRALDEFQTEANRRLKRVWDTLKDTEQTALKHCLEGKPAELRSLRVRGLVTEQGQLFGKVLETWLIEYNGSGD